VPIAIVRVVLAESAVSSLGSKSLEVLKGCERRNTARTYLFLQMMRLEPANCSGAAVAFFLAIALSDCPIAQGAIRRMQGYECFRALDPRKVWTVGRDLVDIAGGELSAGACSNIRGLDSLLHDRHNCGFTVLDYTVNSSMCFNSIPSRDGHTIAIIAYDILIFQLSH